MTKFYDVRNPQGERAWIAARDDSEEHRLFVWLANTARWHWNDALQADFYSNDPGMEYVPVTPEQAAQISAASPKVNRVTAGWIVDDLAAARSLSSTDLGLPTAPTPRPTTGTQLIDTILGTTHWVVVTEYPQESVRAARTLASEIRTGKKSGLRTLGPLEARARTEAGRIVVEARRVPKVDQTQGRHGA